MASVALNYFAKQIGEVSPLVVQLAFQRAYRHVKCLGHFFKLWVVAIAANQQVFYTPA